MNNPSPTISDAMREYLESKAQSRSPKTAETYRFALKRFLSVLRDEGVTYELSPAASLSEDMVTPFIKMLSTQAVATERLYLDALIDFFRYLEAENYMLVNIERLRYLVRIHGRKRPVRLPWYPDEQVEKLIAYALNLVNEPVEDDWILLRNLRDRALVVTLADTGLRISEACSLSRGDIQMERAVIIGKGNKQGVIRFSERALAVIHDYLKERTRMLDGGTGKPLSSLPLFARHDRGAGKKKVKRMTSATGRNIFEHHVALALGDEWVNRITPHKMRHRFVTHVLRETGNLKLAQELARHENIGITERYAHLTNAELDKGYKQVFGNKP